MKRKQRDSPAKMNFYGIVLPPTHKLKIPEEFAEEYADELSDRVKLTVPSGGVWCIEVKKDNEFLWLHDGWKEFMEQNSVGYSYFILFNYRGNSQFSVSIFDLTATEIQYPCCTLYNNRRRNNVHQGLVHEEHELSDADSDAVEIIGSSVLTPHHGLLNQEISTSIDPQVVQNVLKSSSSAGQSMKQGRVPSAEICVTDNPSFKLIMRKSHLLQRFSVRVPAEFGRRYLKNFEYVQLQDSDGKKWHVGCCESSFGRIMLSRGWNAFVKAKDLVLGDICSFELPLLNEPLLKVSITRAS